jgi:hypothetical protein
MEKKAGVIYHCSEVEDEGGKVCYRVTDEVIGREVGVSTHLLPATAPNNTLRDRVKNGHGSVTSGTSVVQSQIESSLGVCVLYSTVQ